MGITKNYVYLTALGIVFTLAAWPFGFHSFIFMFWNLLILGLLTLDIILTPAPKNLTAHREAEEKLFFKGENTVTFFVHNTGRHGLDIEAKDEALRHFSVTHHAQVQFLAPGQTQAFTFTVIPAKRGYFQSQKIYLRFTGLLGLCKKYAAISCPITYKVYPNVKDLSKYRLMVHNHRLLPTGEKKLRQ
ncbi:MAG: hypothetical protein FWG38_09665, partial [Defluviitaleaceae bacterium]|nr:hypothetical protein [Defluviitaleaceae bacterium]